MAKPIACAWWPGRRMPTGAPIRTPEPHIHAIVPYKAVTPKMRVSLADKLDYLGTSEGKREPPNSL